MISRTQFLSVQVDWPRVYRFVRVSLFEDIGNSKLPGRCDVCMSSSLLISIESGKRHCICNIAIYQLL